MTIEQVLAESEHAARVHPYKHPKSLLGQFFLAQAVTIEQVLAESEHAARVHPAVLRLGLAYADGSVTGGNARCVALLSTLRTVLQARPAVHFIPSNALGRKFSVQEHTVPS